MGDCLSDRENQMQPQQITIEDIWKGTGLQAQSPQNLNFSKDGTHYTLLTNNRIVEYGMDGQQTRVIFDAATHSHAYLKNITSYQFSPDGTKILIETQREWIYRRSYKSYYLLWDGTSLSLVSPERIMYPELSPDGNRIAFVYDNNLYWKDIPTGELTQITTDGKKNHIINGYADWVYEEELDFSKAFHWASDSNHIAYYRFDESDVPQCQIEKYTNSIHIQHETYKYPKVGDQNSKVSIHVYNGNSGDITQLDLGTGVEYVPRIKWNKNRLCVTLLNRPQNDLQLLLFYMADLSNPKKILRECVPWYIDVHDNLTFLADEGFLWTSEKDGFRHIYWYDETGVEKAQITFGNWEVTEFNGFDTKKRTVYYQSNESDTFGSQVWRVNIDTLEKTLITDKPGSNSAKFSPTYGHFVWTHSTINSPPTVTLHSIDGERLLTLADNQKLKEKQKEFEVRYIKFVDVPIYPEQTGHAFLIAPKFDYSYDPYSLDVTKYPVFIYQYSGPGSNQTLDRWHNSYYWWFQLLVQKGYVVACMDGRGTGRRGEAFKKCTQKELGKLETEDQISFAKYLGTLPYVDSDRIGIMGWSYGGFISSLAILKGADTFRAAIAVAPVTNFKWYDTIYTERFMGTTQDNPAGYEENSPIAHADKLRGKFLLIHGTADDNVHFQNSMELVAALIRANKHFDTFFYPNCTHGIYEGNANHHVFTRMTNYVLDNF